MPRIAIAGFQHETNTFSPSPTPYDDFVRGGGSPPLCTGDAIYDAVAGANLPVEGFIQAARSQATLVPILWTCAEPAGHVTEDAFERIVGQICDGIAAAGDLDGVYLDLHGAMVAAHHEDGEGEILARVRKFVGPTMPVVASLDFHGNVTQRMVQEASALTIFRTYPHIDTAETGARAAELLFRLLRSHTLHKAYRSSPYLIPLHEQCTTFEPNRSLYEAVGATDGSILSADMALGFPPADITECGPAVVAYAEAERDAESVADDLFARLLDSERAYGNILVSPHVAISRAMANTSGRPIVLADTQDNSGAGGTGDTTGALADLVRGGARGALVAMIADAEVAAQAHALGVGRSFAAALGGKLGGEGALPFQARFRVEALGDGRFTCTGPVCLGTKCDLGPMALLAVEDTGEADVRVIVSTVRCQALDQAALRHLGVEPASLRILVLKSSVHFRADFDPLAAATLIVEWPGSNPADPRRSAYRRLRAGVRLVPNGPVFQWH